MKSPVIVALDFQTELQALALAEKLDPKQCRVKVGKELFTCSGPAVVEKLVEQGFDVFLDLKFHDIPNTVAQACKAAAELGVWMVNVHASGGRAMMLAAREAIDSLSLGRKTLSRKPLYSKPKLIAVTVLTSLSDEDLKEVGVTEGVEKQVLQLATLSQQCGLDGVVCSPLEAVQLRKMCGNSFDLVTPGVRPAGAQMSDQKRVMTPAAAVKAGSTYLVIGRPITQAADSLAALNGINDTLL